MRRYKKYLLLLILLVQLIVSTNAEAYKQPKSDLLSKATELYQMADYYLLNKQYLKAKIYLENALKLVPDNIEYHKQLALVYQNLKQYNKALTEWNTVLFLEPDDLYSNYELGKLLLEINEYKSAIYYLKKVTKIDSNNKNIHRYYLALAYYFNKNYKLAISTLEPIYKSSSENKYIIFYLANSYFNLKNYNKAEKYYINLLELQPKNIKVLLRLSQIYALTKNKNKLKKTYDKLINLDIDNKLKTEIIKSVSEFFINQKDYLEAVKTFKDLVKLMPDSLELNFILAKLYYETNEYDSAIEYLTICIGLDKNKMGPYILLAGAYERKMAFNKAIEIYKRALAIDDKPTTSLLLGICYYNNKDFDLAYTVFESLTDNSKINEWVYYYLGLISQKNKKSEKALEYFEKVIAVNPKTNNSTVLNYVGYSYAEKGVRLSTAKKYIEKALKIYPDNIYYIDSLAWVYYQQKEYSKAYNTILKIKNFTPTITDAIILEHIGDITLKLKKNKTALKYYKSSLLINEQEHVKKKISKIKVYSGN